MTRVVKCARTANPAACLDNSDVVACNAKAVKAKAQYEHILETCSGEDPQLTAAQADEIASFLLSRRVSSSEFGYEDDEFKVKIAGLTALEKIDNLSAQTIDKLGMLLKRESEIMYVQEIERSLAAQSNHALPALATLLKCDELKVKDHALRVLQRVGSVESLNLANEKSPH